MKTHQLGRALIHLGEALLTGPDVSTDAIRIATNEHRDMAFDELGIGLTTLVALSQVDKRQWLDLAHHFGFPIDVRPKDSTAIVLGRLLRFLHENPSARARLKRRSMNSGKASPELLNALNALLHD